jgi:hypothetical protein
VRSLLARDALRRTEGILLPGIPRIKRKDALIFPVAVNVESLVIANNDLTQELEYAWRTGVARILTAKSNAAEINRL